MDHISTLDNINGKVERFWHKSPIVLNFYASLRKHTFIRLIKTDLYISSKAGETIDSKKYVNIIDKYAKKLIYEYDLDF
jgi:hypothetical protein